MTKVQKIICDHTGEECKDSFVRINHIQIRKPLDPQLADKNIEHKSIGNYHIKSKVADEKLGIKGSAVSVYSADGTVLFYQDKHSFNINPLSAPQKSFINNLFE